jgi:hypothetical protein
MHASGFGSALYHQLVTKCRRKPECYAKFRGIAGCATRMLTGSTCADHTGEVVSPNRIEQAKKAVKKLAFVGLTEEWDESVCLFHRKYGTLPDQKEFRNYHHGKYPFTTEDLHGYVDTADEEVYSVAKARFDEQIRDAGGRCHKKVEKGDMVRRMEACQRLSCPKLGKQCGEWDDGCGGRLNCGFCPVRRDGLPNTWRMECTAEGQCARRCPPWKSLWSRGERSHGEWNKAFVSAGAPKSINISSTSLTLGSLSPIDAIRICAKACENRGAAEFAREYCYCFAPPNKFLGHVTPETIQDAYHVDKYQRTMSLPDYVSQPKCCPPVVHPPRGWNPGTVIADFFETVGPLGCDIYKECALRGRERGAEVAVAWAQYCFLGNNTRGKLEGSGAAGILARHHIKL